jgi:hypothetical protein
VEARDFFPMKKEDVYARMMHTPDDPERAETRATLRAMWKQLLPLHRALIDDASAHYRANGGEVSGPTHLLQLLQEEEFFAWLRPITTLIVDLDSMARTDFSDDDVATMVGRVESFFGAEANAAFAERYIPVMQREFDVTVAHAAIRQAVGKLKKNGA